MPAPWPVDTEHLRDQHCLFGVDRVAGRPDVTEFKRRARWQQSWWRVEQGLPMGSHRRAGPDVVTANGSRLEVATARTTGANFLSGKIRSAVEDRLAHPQPHQTLDETRLWSDLLSSMPMCFNLFGERHDDAAGLAEFTRAVWPHHPGVASQIMFEWSPGRRDPLYLNNRSAFDAAILVDLGGDRRGVIGIETKYHEDIRREAAPHPQRRFPRYREVTEAAEIFAPGWEQAVVGTDLQQIWLDHLLLLSMLHHPDARWTWGCFVVVHPEANPSVRDATQRYRQLLRRPETFDMRTIEELLDTHALHDPGTEVAFRERYLW